MTLLRWLTFVVGSQTVILTVLLFWISFFLLMLVFVLQWLSLHWEILIMFLSQFPLPFHQIHGRISFFYLSLQKAFDTVDHQILLAKLNHYGICGVSNDWFKSYLSNRSRYLSISGYESGLAALNCGVPQGSVLGPLLFLLYTNDLNQAIKFCKVHHFTDDTNLLFLSNSIKN